MYAGRGCLGAAAAARGAVNIARVEIEIAVAAGANRRYVVAAIDGAAVAAASVLIAAGLMSWL